MQLRSICTCARLQSAQLGRIVNKVMNLDRTKKNKKREFNFEPSVIPSFASGSKKSSSTIPSRRVTVLNKLYMKHITDLMTTGEVGSQLVGKGIEVSHVRVASDFQNVYVYWFTDNTVNTSEIEEVLMRAAGHLQHELSQLPVIGKIPPIRFVENKHVDVSREIERILTTVDFGEGYVPTAHLSQSVVPTLQTSLSPEIKSRINEISKENNNEKEKSYDITIPEMRQDVLGVDHFAIMTRIKNSLSKIKTVEQREILGDTPSTAVDVSNTPNTVPRTLSFSQSADDKKMFDEFLKKRVTEERRKRRAIVSVGSRQEDEEELDRILDRDDELNEQYEDEYDPDYYK